MTSHHVYHIVHSKRVSGSNSPSGKTITHVLHTRRGVPGSISEAAYPRHVQGGGGGSIDMECSVRKEGEPDQAGELCGHQVMQAHRPFEETGV